MAVHAFRGEDFFSLDDLLSDEEKQIRDAARQFVTDKVMPVIDRHFRAGTFPMELIPQFGEMGFLGANLHGYDCAGLSNVAYGILMQELERGDSGIRSYCSVQGGLVMYPIYEYGSEEQKKKWLPQLAKGQKTGCFGLSEPDHGSDPAGMETRAVLKGNEWVLNGSKRWITNGTIADVAVVWARTDQGIRGFLVEKGMKGYSAPLIEGKFSLRASVTSELVFEDVHLPEGRDPPQGRGAQGAALLPHPGALRDRVGRGGQHARRLRRGRLLHQVAHPVPEADRELPARPGEARRDPHHARRTPSSSRSAWVA